MNRLIPATALPVAVVGYVRYSVRRNKYRGASERRRELTEAAIAEMESSRRNQRGKIEARAAAKGFDPPEFFEDMGISGTRPIPRRPGLLAAAARAQELARSGRRVVLMGSSLARLGRSPLLVPFVQEQLAPWGISLGTVQEDLDFTSATGELMATIMLSVLKFYCAHTGEQVRESNALLKARGYWTGGLMFGTRPSDRPGVPERDPDTWPLLEECFRRSARGDSDAGMARWIRGLRVPGVKGGDMTPKAMRGMLSSRFYVDETLLHECKVPRDLWQAAQRAQSRRGRPAEDDHALLSGQLVNGWWLQDGAPARLYSAPNISGRRYALSRSNHYVQWPAERHPDAPRKALRGVQQDWLDGLVLARLEQLCAEDGSGLLRRRASALRASGRDGLQGQLTRVRAELERAQRESLACKKRITQAFDKGLDDLAQEYHADLQAARRVEAAAREELDRTEAALEALAAGRRGAQEAADHAQAQLGLAQELRRLGDWEGLRRLLRLLVDQVELRLHLVPGRGFEKFGTVRLAWSQHLFQRPGMPSLCDNTHLASSRRT